MRSVRLTAVSTDQFFSIHLVIDCHTHLTNLSIYLGEQCENWWRPVWVDNRPVGWARGWYCGIQLPAADEWLWLWCSLLWNTGPTSSYGSFCEYLYNAIRLIPIKMSDNNIIMQNFIQRHSESHLLYTLLPATHQHTKTCHYTPPS